MVLYQTSKESLGTFQKLISSFLITSLSLSSLETRDHTVSLEKILGQTCCIQSSMEQSLKSTNNCCHLKTASVGFKLYYHSICPFPDLLVPMNQKEEQNYLHEKKMLKILSIQNSHIFLFYPGIY